MTAIVTFISDFGESDGYTAQVKGRILSANRDITIVDVNHSVPPYSLVSGAWLLGSAWQSFPAGTIHLAVVDPGVGTERRALVVEKDGHFFVGPDNGIFAFIYPAEKIFTVTWRPENKIAPTFHGRDLFAPIVNQLLDGKKPEELGAPVNDPLSLDTARPMAVHCDRFGNIITNIPDSKLDSIRGIECGDQVIDQKAGTFAEIKNDAPALIRGSQSTIEICANRRNASTLLGVRPGDGLRIID